jgi:hypothetical protein
MSTPNDQTDSAKIELYRARAAECERRAAEAGSLDTKRWFTEAAREWLRLAGANTISN